MTDKKISLLLLLCLLSISITFADPNPKPFVIPELKSWKGGEGTFSLNKQCRIIYPKGNTALEKIARETVTDAFELLGLRLTAVSDKARAGDIVLVIKKDKSLEKEGYTMVISDRVTLAAPAAIGVYWSTRSLLQIAEQHRDGLLPKGTIRDFPDYALRGFMIDCGRKFIPLHTLKAYVKTLAYYKMNTLQIHLNDNGFKQFFNNDWSKTYAAFRLESESFPGLTARDGYYTKQEFIDLQKLAEDRYVEIIPEIDIPAHTLAFSQYRPEVGSKTYGMDHLDLFNPETYNFVDTLFREYLEGLAPVFRGPRVHIGTDEYSNKDPKVVEKFREFTDRYIKYIESFGKQAVVWGALTHAKGNTPVKVDNVLMSIWYNGYANPEDMAAKGYKLISMPDGLLYIVPIAGYYYDYLDTKYLYEKWTPAHIGKVVFKERDPVILGGMFAVWNDHVGNGISVGDINSRLFPAIQTLSAKMWSGKNVSLSFADFDQQRHRLSEAPGINQLGRISNKQGLVFEQHQVQPLSTLPYEAIGYDYYVSFDIDAEDEQPGTVLFQSTDARFYLSDPIRGMLGFARDGYLNTFKYALRKGDRLNIGIAGNNHATMLYVNGKLFEKLDTTKMYFNAGKDAMNYIRTLVFPLQHTGSFKSKITNLKVYNTLPEVIAIKED